MPVSMCCISTMRRLEKKDIEILLNDTDNIKDYMLLNSLERNLIRCHGSQFIIESSDKVQYIMGFILQNNVQGLYDMYSNCFDLYMNECGGNIASSQSFNIVFSVLIHMAKKILRKSKDSNMIVVGGKS